MRVFSFLTLSLSGFCDTTGNIATEEVMEDIKEGRFTGQVPISLADVISAVEWLLTLSNTVDIGEINMYQKG